jgi:proteasome lid subunit RPN8/RPN11
VETQGEKGMARWTAAECPFAIEYSTRVLDDIRLAVTDAFFSLPRGGAEIGGILLGRREKDRITVVDALPMECEHAFGPSFVLSPRDLDKLGTQVAAADRNPAAKVVGWYHSHTRSEIFLSEADLEIHRKFFPQPWQVALVLKPHTFQPTRAGFFFREKDGSVHADAPYSEFALEPLPMRPVPANGGPAATPAYGRSHDLNPDGPVIDVSGVAEAEGPRDDAVHPEPQPDVAPPAFLTSEPKRSRRWATACVAAALGVSLGAWGYHTRGEWLPRVQAAIGSPAPEKVALAVLDRDGHQLQIQWNGSSRAALASTAGSLLIVDGDKPLTVELGRPRVLTGSFTYARHTGKVDVTLILPQPGGKEVREAVLFSGTEPPSKAAEAAPAGANPRASDEPIGSREALAAENARLKEEIARQTERSRRLEKTLDETRKAWQREQQRRRLGLQSPDAAK